MASIVSNQICPELNLKDSLYLWRHIWGIKHQKQLDFSDFFGTQDYLLTNTARSALTVLIDHLDLPKDKSIGIPAFMCCVVAVPFLEAGYSVKWIDTDDQGLMDTKDFSTKLADISLVIVPHIFGQKADLGSIYKEARKHNILVVEDCAHRLPDTKWEADFRLYSFGREKVLSCVSGGALVANPTLGLPREGGDPGRHNTWIPGTPSREDLINSNDLPSASTKWTLQHMLQPLIYSLSLPWYRHGGKIIPYLAQKLKLLPLAVTPREKKGHASVSPERLSFPIQKLLKRQTNLLSKKIDHKKAISQLWHQTLTKKLNLNPEDIIIPDNYFRVIVKINPDFRDNLMKKAQKNGYYLREWDGVPLSPKGVDLRAFRYQKGSCPKAETFAQSYLTLPTNQRTNAKAVVEFGKIFSI